MNKRDPMTSLATNENAGPSGMGGSKLAKNVADPAGNEPKRAFGASIGANVVHATRLNAQSNKGVKVAKYPSKVSLGAALENDKLPRGGAPAHGSNSKAMLDSEEEEIMELLEDEDAEMDMHAGGVNAGAFGGSQFKAVLRALSVDDLNDPLYVSSYLPDIISHLVKTEQQYVPSNNFLARQDSLEPHMRRTLNNWLIQVHNKYKLAPDTMYLCVNYVDRFLAKVPVSCDKLQLVGATGLLIASKYEDIMHPLVQEISEVCAHIYSKKDIVKMESIMLASLGFDMCVPTPWMFLQIFTLAAGLPLRSEYCYTARYITETMTLLYEFASVPPSLQAAVACWIAIRMLNIPVTNELLSVLSLNGKYTEETFKKYALLVLPNLICIERKIRAAYERFKEQRRFRTSKLKYKLLLEKLGGKIPKVLSSGNR